MKISEIASELTKHYREHKKSNGGHKTSAADKYSFKTIRYFVGPKGTKELGPFLGRGSALIAYRDKIKGKHKGEVDFTVETVVIFKDKKQPEKVLKTDVFTLTVTEKAPKKTETEQEKIARVLRKHDYNRTATAKELGMSTDTLRNRIKKFGIEIPEKVTA